MLSVYSIILDNNQEYGFLDMMEAHKVMLVCMKKDVNFYYMERFMKDGSKAHQSFLRNMSKTDYFKRLADQEEVPLEQRWKQSYEEKRVNMQEKKVIVKEMITAELEPIRDATEDKPVVQPEVVEDVVEKPKKEKKTKVQPEVVEDVVEVVEKPKKEKKTKVQTEVVEDVVDVVEKPKKEKKAKVQTEVEDVEVVEKKQGCTFVLTRGERRGQPCQKPCVGEKDTCRVHDK